MRCSTRGAGSVQLQRHLHQLQPLFLLQCLKGRALPDNPLPTATTTSKWVHMSAYNTTHFGTAVFNNHQNAYIFFNEREAPQLALSTIYLQLPMYDFPPPAQRALPLSGLQPQPHSPPHPLHQTLGQHLHGRLPGTERPAHPPRPADRRATPPTTTLHPASRGDFIKTCSVPLPC